jgi:hypothetical protein
MVENGLVSFLGPAFPNEPHGGGLQPRVVPNVGKSTRPHHSLDYAGHVHVKEGSRVAVLKHQHGVRNVLSDGRDLPMLRWIDWKARDNRAIARRQS